MFALFPKFGAKLVPRIFDLFSSRKPGWNFSYEPKAKFIPVTGLIWRGPKTSSRVTTTITFSCQNDAGSRVSKREHYQLGKSRTRSRPHLQTSSRPFVSDTSPKFILGRRCLGTRQSATLSIRFIRKCARIIPADTWRCYRCLVAAWIMATWHRKKRYGYQFFLDRLRWVPSLEYSSSFSFLFFSTFFCIRYLLGSSTRWQ